MFIASVRTPTKKPWWINITGGGEEKFKAENDLFYLKPEIVCDIDPDVEKVKEKISVLIEPCLKKFIRSEKTVLS